MTIAFPESIDVWALCVRAMFVKYDHYSSRCRSYDEPETPLLLTMGKTQ